MNDVIIVKFLELKEEPLDDSSEGSFGNKALDFPKYIFLKFKVLFLRSKYFLFCYYFEDS